MTSNEVRPRRGRDEKNSEALIEALSTRLAEVQRERDEKETGWANAYALVRRLEHELHEAHEQNDTLTTRIAVLEAALNESQNGNRPIAVSRDTLGRLVREAWVRWAKTQDRKSVV